MTCIEGKKEKFSDDSLRPALSLDDYKDALTNNVCTKTVAALGFARQRIKALSYGDYRELILTNRQYAYSRSFENVSAIITANNDDSSYVMTVPAGNAAVYVGVLSGEHVTNNNGNISVNIPANSGDIWISEEEYNKIYDGSDAVTKMVSNDAEVQEESENITTVEAAPENITTVETAPENNTSTVDDSAYKAAYEDGVIAGLHEAIIARMEKNGFVTDQMRRDVYNNTHHESLINWIKSF